jgi:hypothetical protein
VFLKKKKKNRTAVSMPYIQEEWVVPNINEKILELPLFFILNSTTYDHQIVNIDLVLQCYNIFS